MNWLKASGTYLWNAVKGGFGYFLGPIDPNQEDAFQKATRFKLALGISIVLSLVFLISFYHAITNSNLVRVELFLDYSRAICISLVSMIGVYLGARSLRGRGPYGGSLGRPINHYKSGEPQDEEEEQGLTEMKPYDPSAFGSDDSQEDEPESSRPIGF